MWDPATLPFLNYDQFMTHIMLRGKPPQWGVTWFPCFFTAFKRKHDGYV